MPGQQMHSTAFRLHFPADFLTRFADLTPTEKQSALAGLGNALRTVAALLLMRDRGIWV
jgi:DEAD/DEAH box helicase domain-containing protein